MLLKFHYVEIKCEYLGRNKAVRFKMQKKMNVIISSLCLLQKSSFLLKKTKDKDFLKINRDFIKISIHQIDNRLKYSFTSSQLFAFYKMNILT